MSTATPRGLRCIVILVLAAMVAGGCSTATLTTDAAGEPDASVPSGEPAEADDEVNDPNSSRGPASSDKPDPVPYVPAATPGSPAEYQALVSKLEAEIPTELRADVPWPNLRQPNPIVAQDEIFDFWIWMAATLPEPRLVEMMTADASPSREEVVSIFGLIDQSGNLEERRGQPYETFDHVVVTFESAGLPLWLARDVPDNAVVVYYRDKAGPTTVVDRDTGAVVDVRPAVSTRSWLSIMVPTDAGWRLWRDQLIEPTDTELEIPDVPPPGADGVRPLPEV